MSLTTAQLDTLIESARVALQAALDSPKPNYRLGGRTVDFADYIKTLREQLMELCGMQADLPSEKIHDFDSEITDQGEDNSQYEGDKYV